MKEFSIRSFAKKESHGVVGAYVGDSVCPWITTDL